MMWVLVGGAVLVGLFGAAFFCGCETGLYCVNRLRVQLGVQERDPKLLRISSLLENEQETLSVTLIGANLMHYVTTTAVAFMFTELLYWSGADTELFTVLLVTPVVFVFAEVVPKNLFQLHADRLMPRGSWLLTLADRVFRATGIVWLLTKLTRAATRLFGGATSLRTVTAPKRRMTMLLQEALVGHTHGEHQSDLIDRVVRLSETPVRAVMVPQQRVVAVAATADRRELIRFARQTGFARCPVYGKRRSEIIGVIKVDELLRNYDWRTVGERLGPVTTLRPQETVASAIAHMKQGGGEFGVVSDQAGQMVGVVTLRDLLEEVVGEFGRGA
jgi:CBS domain containing-hemolysin-like protein